MSNQPSTVATVAATLKPTELKLGQPSAFDGETTKARAWLNTMQIYLHINKKVYGDDEKMITYALSFMAEGAAGLWATTFLTKALATGTPNFGTYANFLTQFKEMFFQENTKDQAIAWLTTTQVSKNFPLVEYISHFKNNAVLSEINNQDALINFFSRGIPIQIMRIVLSMDTVPTTIEKWYSQALHFKLTWEREEYITKQRGNTFFSFQSNQTRNTSYQRTIQKSKDPNAMDIDAVQIGKLTPEERQWCINNNLCFKCRKPGHLAIKCWTYPSNQQNTPTITKN